MTNLTKIKYYSPIEERINIISHAFGFFLSIYALLLLVVHAYMYGGAVDIISFTVFGISLLIVYAASTLYHSSKKPELRLKMKVLDHAAIYVLIAGTYTPFTLITLHGTSIGWILFALSWTLALFGIILKLFFTGKLTVLSTMMYLLMGWIIVFAIKPLIDNLPIDGLFWFIAGGVAYTIGAILYSIKKIKFNHAIFHILVLVGSFSHFITVFVYVLPRK